MNVRIPALLLLWAASARHAGAAELALYSGDPATATASLASVFPDHAPDAFDLRPIDAWLAAQPVTLTAGTFQVCPAAPARGWKDSVAAAMAPLDDMDYEIARPHLEEAHNAVLCAAEPVNGDEVARMEYLRGVVAQFEGDPTAAASAFRAALDVQRDMAWDPAFPPSARVPFDDAQKALPTSTTSVAVVPRNAPVWLDGRPLDPGAGPHAVPDGTHLLQVGADKPISLRVAFDRNGAASLAVPAAVPANATSWAADPALSTDLARLIALYAPGQPVLVVDGSAVYRGGNGALGLTPVAPPPKKSSFNLGMGLAAGGGAVTVGGVAVAVAGLVAGNAAVNDGNGAATWEDYQSASDRYGKARGLVTVGWGAAAAGAAIAAAGGALYVHDSVSIAPQLAPRGAGLALTVGGVR